MQSQRGQYGEDMIPPLNNSSYDGNNLLCPANYTVNGYRTGA